MVRFGVPGQNIDTLAYVDTRLATVPAIQAPRSPTVNDKKYPLWCEWRVNRFAVLPDQEGDFWKLIRFESNGDATWVQFTSGGGGPIINVRTDDGLLVAPDGVGVMDLDGVVVANATNAKPLFTEGSVANTVQFELQVGAAITGAPADTNDAGIVSFDDTAFNVDANGYVTLAGGAGPAIDSIDVDFNTAPGTDPVLPTAGGQVRISGNTVTNATNANAPVASHSRAANAFNIEVQLAAAITGAPADPFDVGLCSFDDTAFTVDGNGYVELIGGAGPSAQSFAVDANTAPGTDPVVPDATGQVTVSGAAVAAHSVPIETHSRAANAYNIEVQYADETATSTAASSGICHFDSSDFDVDASGFVELANPPINPTVNLNEFDDFLGTRDTDVAGGQSKLGWIATGASIVEWNPDITTESGHPGIVRFRNSGATQAGTMNLGINSGVPNDGAGLTLGAGILTVNWIAKVVSLSDVNDDVTVNIGIGMSPGVSSVIATATMTDGLFFTYSYDVNSGDWQIINRAASTDTTGNTSNTVDTDWHKYTIVVNAAATSVSYFIDDVEVDNSPQTTNIPTSTDLGVFAQTLKAAHTGSKDFYVDLVEINYDLTSARY